jgi:hypothetical protein
VRFRLSDTWWGDLALRFTVRTAASHVGERERAARTNESGSGERR